MAYTYDDWLARHRERIDISAIVTHLTREGTMDGKHASAVEVLVKILREQRIVGSDAASGFVVGVRRAVCFQDAPLLGLAQNARFEGSNPSPGGRVRYRGVGLAFNKFYAYRRGARPVLYEDTEVAKKMLPPDQHWRIVRFDLSNERAVIDWTHEREWRAPDEFCFARRYCAVVLDSRDDYLEFLRLAPDIAGELSGVSVLGHAVA